MLDRSQIKGLADHGAALQDRALGGAETVETGCEQGADAGRNWLRRPPEVARVQAWVSRYERIPLRSARWVMGVEAMQGKSAVPGLFFNPKETRRVEAGTVIFAEGEPGTEMFGIIEGEVELRGSGGLHQHLGPRDVFGEMALIDESARSATAVAVSGTTLATIDRHRFLFLVQETPTFALDVMSVMAERLRRRS